MRLSFALLSIFTGLSLAFGGYRLARFLIPLMGFLAGLSLGGAVVSDLSGEVFLGTLLGVGVGVAAGILLAVLAYFYYFMAVVILAASLGYLAGSGFVDALRQGVDNLARVLQFHAFPPEIDVLYLYTVSPQRARKCAG